jgi:nucleotide-binding universal stress UspA family protein
MHRFTNIVFVPLGDKENPAAVRRLADLAKRNRAELTLLGVLEEPTGLHRLLDRPRLDDEVRQVQQDELARKLHRWGRQTGDYPAKEVISAGNPAIAIVQQVLRHGHDLVVVTSDEDRHDHATIKRLLRKCPCPVWVIRPTRARKVRVLAAVNPFPEEAELNLRIIELATAMGELYDAELHVAHAWELAGETTMRNSAFIHTTPEEVDRLLDQEHEAHRRALDELLATRPLPESGWNVHLVNGSAHDVIVHTVNHCRINLLIMGTVARTGLPGLLMGNTAEQVLDDVRCSVLAIKPPGFVSPIHL